ncbi:MAG: PaaI family thioesterase [Bacteroidota bacterium]
MHTSQKAFQEHMLGNVCFGCGQDNHEGLKIKSYWDGEEAVCIFNSHEKYQGWKGLMNGGIIATLVDCHSMCTAMAAAYRSENRALDSLPEYRYATGTMTLKYLKPTPNDQPITIRATVREIKGRKVVVDCSVIAKEKVTVKAEVIAIRVFDSSQNDGTNPFRE